MEEEVISNRFTEVLGEWICIHDESEHFPNWNPAKPAIKLCSKTLRVRANDAFTKLPLRVQEALVAHEVAHRELEHHLTPSFSLLRVADVCAGSVSEKELQADRLAARRLGKDLYALALRNYIALTGRSELSRLELVRRIAAVEALS